MPIFGPDFVEGKVYRGKKKTEEDEERHALSELQSLLNAKNRRSCDCEAQVHDLLENCLNCGRLTCTAEGPGKCFSCGSIVLEQEQRERLRKHIDIVQPTPGVKTNPGTSTRIIDSQFDYFSVDSKKHLRESERQTLRNEIEDLQSKRYQKKLVLNVDLDNLEANAKSVSVVDDYEEELKRLQIKDQPSDLTGQYRLSELVQREYRKDFNFEYVDANALKRSAQRQPSDKTRPGSKDPDQKPRTSYDNKPKTKNSQEKGDKNKSAWNSRNNKNKVTQKN